MSENKIIVPAILKKTTVRDKRHLMTYLVAAFFSFSFSILAASIAIFLQNRFSGHPNAIFFVGAILGLASVGALFIDTFWVSLQKVYRSRFLFFCALGGVMATVAIFLFSGVFPILGWGIFTVLAAIFYGWSYDLYDVTILTTILRRGKKENYAQNISQKKFAEAIGMIFGISISGFLLFFGTVFAQSVLLFLLVGVFVFAAKNFDRDGDEKVALEFSEKSLVDWKSVFFVISHPAEIQKKIENAGENLKKEILILSKQTEAALKNLPEKAKKSAEEIKESARKKLIEMLARENEIVKKEFPEPKIRFSKMIAESKKLIADFFEIFRENGRALLIWAAIVVIFFSFWDTMAATFQPLFLRKITETSGFLRAFSGVLMAGFLLPILFFQMPFAALADRFGRGKFVLLGILVSGVSLIFLGTAENLSAIFLAGLGNSLGYALAFVPAQAMLAAEIEKSENASPEKSAGILRVALNLGNIFGQFLGGLLFAAVGFKTGFFGFGTGLLVFSIFSFFFLFRETFFQKNV